MGKLGSHLFHGLGRNAATRLMEQLSLGDIFLPAILYELRLAWAR